MRAYKQGTEKNLIVNKPYGVKLERQLVYTARPLETPSGNDF